MKMRGIALLLALLLALAGCSSVPIRDTANVTLPPIASPVSAPVGDQGGEITQRVMLSLPGAVTGQLTLVSDRLALPASRHPAEAALSRLFSFQTNEQARALSESGALQLMPGRGVEISGGTAVVNLAASALSLSAQELFRAGMAVTNTLSQWGDIRHVNILVNDQHPGLDPAATMPLGSLVADTSPGAAASLWETRGSQRTGNVQGGFSLGATLYFPAAAGRGVLAEGRTLSFPGASLSTLARSLLGALSAGAATLPGVPQVPDLNGLLISNPLVEELPGAQGRVILLSFDESANERLIAAGIPRSVMMASICLTLTTFLPGVAGIRVRIGTEMISAVVPAGVLEGAGQEIVFEDQVMRRTDFLNFLLDYCTLYFADGAGTLGASRRAVPYHQTRNPRYVLNELLSGPEYTDTNPGLSAVLPQGIKDADWLGIARHNGTLAVNISAAANTLFNPLNEVQERLMVYGMVNTLAELAGVDKVQFFIDGKQEGRFAGHIDLAGSFLPSTGMVAR
ncbi:MAG: GerMN domain-containing protein [Eubacteriales bacterium]|nr:GerMN domain-containing protein [Eubacteriales bacterium]